jgi:hypothetical protein
MDSEGRVYWRCTCGYKDYDFEANFCSRCGEKRPDEAARVEALNGLFEKTKQEIRELADFAKRNEKRSRKGGRGFIGDQE